VRRSCFGCMSLDTWRGICVRDVVFVVLVGVLSRPTGVWCLLSHVGAGRVVFGTDCFVGCGCCRLGISSTRFADYGLPFARVGS